MASGWLWAWELACRRRIGAWIATIIGEPVSEEADRRNWRSAAVDRRRTGSYTACRSESRWRSDSAQSFRVPVIEARVLSNSPRSAAVTLIVERAVVCPAGFLTRGVKPDVDDVYSGSERHAEGLDRAVEVLVIQRVFIVPDASLRDWSLCNP